MTNFPEKTFNQLTIVDQPVESDDSTLVPTTNWVRNVLRQEYDLSKYLKLSDDNTQTVTGNVVFNNIDVANVTDWTSNQAVNAVTSDGRYIRSNDTDTQTITSIVLVPTVTDWSKEQIIGASDADNRYVRLNSSTTQTITSNLNFIGTEFYWKNSVGSTGHSKISFSGNDAGSTSLNFYTTSSATIGSSITSTGLGPTSNINLSTSSVTVPSVTDWTKTQAVDAVSADNRYLRLNDSNTQTVSGPIVFSNSVDFTGNTTVITQADSDNSTKAASTAYVTSLITKEALARSTADTNLDNTKLNISGGEVTGNLTIDKNLTIDGNLLVNGNSSRVYNSASNKWGNMYIDNAGNYTFDLNDGSPSNSAGALSWLRLYPDGNLRTNLGTVAFQSNIPIAGTINGGGYYTKIPLNDGTGRSILTQAFTAWAGNWDNITFPIPFSSTPQVVMSIQHDDDGNSNIINFRVGTITNTYFGIDVRWVSHKSSDGSWGPHMIMVMATGIVS